MKVTLEYILYTQSPTLFLAALLLLIAHFIRRKEHRFRAVADLIAAIVCIGLGVALYFIGIGQDVFTIHDFWQVRTPGWVGMALVLVLACITLFRTVKRAIDRRRASRSAKRSEREHQQQLEDTWKDAYASGMADAMAAESRAQAAEPAAPSAEAQPTAEKTAEE